MGLLFSAWPLVVRKSLANWRLLSSIVVGVFVAVALLSSTPLYSNALNDLGLIHALKQQPAELLDVHVYAPNYPIDLENYQRGGVFIDQQASRNIGELLRQKERYMRSQTFYAAWADRPIPTDPLRPRGHFQVFTNLEKHVTLVEGRYPEPLPAGLSQEQLDDSEFEIEAMIGSETAELFDVGVGDQLLFIHPWGSPPKQVTIRLTGIIDPVDPREEYWFLMTDVFTVPIDSENPYITAALFIPEQTFFEGVGRVFPTASATYNWFYYVDPTKVNTQNAEAVKNAVNDMESQIVAELPRSALLTSLGGVISSYQHKLLFTQIPLFLLVFQIVGIVLYYVVTVANMVIDRQTGEIALLRSRGASTGQIFGVYFMEGLLISVIGGVGGPFLGAFVFSMLGKTAAFFPLSGGGLLPIRFSTSVFLMAAGAALLCLIALLLPALNAARLGMVHQRQRAARPPRAPFWQRFYLDLVLLAIGGVLYWELRGRGALITRNIFGELNMDPLPLITPMLFMVAVAVIFLRLFPIILNLAAKLGRYVTNAPVVLGLWYMARNPIHYGRLILLLMMAASVGMFAASFLGTLERSYDERALYITGSDIRLEGLYDWRTSKGALTERYSALPGVEDLSLAHRGSATVGGMTAQMGFTLLALDPESLGPVAWYRDDFSKTPFPEILNLLAEDQPVKQGLDLPEGTESIGLWVYPMEPYPNLHVFARITDGRGSYMDRDLGALTAEGWQYLETDLKSLGTERPPTAPISLRAIYIRQEGQQSRQVPEGVYFDDLQVRGSFSSEPVVVEDFEDVGKWTLFVQESSSWISAVIAGQKDTFATNNEVVHNGAASGEFSWIPRRTFGHRGIYPNLDTRPMAILASRSLLSGLGASVGDEIQMRVPGQFIPVVIKDVVDYFPTLDPADRGFVIANLDRIMSTRNLALGGSSHLYPNEVWLSVTDDKEQREILLETLNTGGFRARELYDKEEIVAVSKADPLVAAGWGGILLIAFLGVILVSGLGFVVYAYLSARGRQLEFAILRTLGFSLRQIIGVISLEQLFVIGSGMGIGTLIGLRLSSMMMPFLQLTERGQRVLPPFVPVVDWLTIGIAYVILAVAFILTTSLVILFYSRVALHRALRMGDE